MKHTIPIIFAVCTALCWGLYGPTVANARSATKEWSAFKPYVFIGVAYLVFACGGGLLGMKLYNDPPSFTGTQKQAAVWGFAAGTFGAMGAFCLTSAMLSFAGPPRPQLVMPIVFGGAVTVTAIVSVIQSKDAAAASPLLWLGMALVVAGIVLVAYYTPHGKPHKPKPEAPAAAAPAESPAESQS